MVTVRNELEKNLIPSKNYSPIMNFFLRVGRFNCFHRQLTSTFYILGTT